MSSGTYDRLVNHPRMLGFARLYAGFVPLLVILMFVPLFQRTEEVQGVEVVEPIRSMWDELTYSGHSLTTFSFMLMIAMIGLLIAGAFGVHATGVPIAIGVALVLLMWMLIGRPGFGEGRTPDLAPWGQVGVMLGILGFIVAGTHAALTIIAKRRP